MHGRTRIPALGTTVAATMSKFDKLFDAINPVYHEDRLQYDDNLWDNRMWEALRRIYHRRIQ